MTSYFLRQAFVKLILVTCKWGGSMKTCIFSLLFISSVYGNEQTKVNENLDFIVRIRLGFLHMDSGNPNAGTKVFQDLCTDGYGHGCYARVIADEISNKKLGVEEKVKLLTMACEKHVEEACNYKSIKRSIASE